MTIAVDKEGFLVHLEDWNADVAQCLARQDGIELTDDHWALIRLIREFHEEYHVSPVMRVLVKRVRERLGPERGNSLYLLRLFPGSPAKVLARVAGLPRPTNCL